jgi:hypothetical protein
VEPWEAFGHPGRVHLGPFAPDDSLVVAFLILDDLEMPRESKPADLGLILDVLSGYHFVGNLFRHLSLLLFLEFEVKLDERLPESDHSRRALRDWSWHD